MWKIYFQKRREVNRKNANILDELNSYPEIFSLSWAIEISKQYLFLRTDI